MNCLHLGDRVVRATSIQWDRDGNVASENDGPALESPHVVPWTRDSVATHLGITL